MTTKPKPRYVMHWDTVAVTALPAGWRNVYRGSDGTAMLSPCPAILLQELRETTKGFDYVGADGRPDVQMETTKETPPYETRAVFADADGAVLEPADDAINYERTLGPGEQP